MLAVKLLWAILSKQCAFFNSPVGQNFSTATLLHRLSTVLHHTSIIRRSSTAEFLLYLINSITVLAFSGERRVMIEETTWEDILDVVKVIDVECKEVDVPYTLSECLHILLSRSRYVHLCEDYDYDYYHH